MSGLFGLILGLLRRRKSIRVTGRILEYDQNSQFQFVPVIQFEQGGRGLKIKLDRGFRRKIAEEGQRVEIYFNPRRIQYVKLARDYRDIWCSLILLLCGFLSVFFLTI